MQFFLKYFFVYKTFVRWVGMLLWPGYLLSFALLFFGCYHGFIVPADVTQGEVFRIIYVHVPLAALSLGLYVALSVCVMLDRGLHLKMADAYALACAVGGALITALVLITGSIWAKPTWGTWWIWDARITSEVILLMLYMAYIAVRTGIDPPLLARQVAAWVALLGLVDLPLVHFSVQWWYTLHQGPTLLQFAQPKMPWILLYPLLITGLGFFCLTFCMVMHTAMVIRQLFASTTSIDNYGIVAQDKIQ